MPLNAKQLTRDDKISISRSPPARPSLRSVPEAPHQLVVHQLVTFLTETAVGNNCCQLTNGSIGPPITHDLQTHVRGKDDNSKTGTSIALALCKQHHYPCRKRDMEVRQTATGSSPGGADGQTASRLTTRLCRPQCMAVVVGCKWR